MTATDGTGLVARSLASKGDDVNEEQLQARIAQLEHENAELRARLDAVFYTIDYGAWLRDGENSAPMPTFDEWLTKQRVAQPNDAAAPLTLATIDDEDGDTQPRVPNWANAPQWAQWHAIEADGRGYWFPFSPLPKPWGGAFWHIPGLGEFDARYNMDGIDFTTTLTARPQAVQP